MISINQRSPGTFLVRLEREINYSNSPELHEAIARLCNGDVEQIVLDFTDVESIDSSGIATLIEGQKQSHDRKADFILVGISTALKAWFDRANLGHRIDDVFELAPSIHFLQIKPQSARVHRARREAGPTEHLPSF